MQYFSILLYLSSKFPVNIDSRLSLCSPQPLADEEDRGMGYLGWASLGAQRCQGQSASCWEGLWGSICSIFMTLYKSRREWWQTPWTGCQETSSPAVARCLTHCVALGRSRFLGLVSLSVKRDWLALMDPQLWNAVIRFLSPSLGACRVNSCSEQRSYSNLTFLLETQILNPAVTGRHFEMK